MKKIITIVVILCFTLTTKSQNLTFNKAVMVGSSFNVGGGWGVCGSSDSIIVPTGKIWKIEKYIKNNEMYINGKQIYNESSDCSPIWLNPGDVIIFAACNTQNSYGGNHPYFMNGIEFSLTQ